MYRPIRLLTIIGARPQIIKAAALHRAIGEGSKDHLEEIVLHTGQHYDAGMSGDFFTELGLPGPAIQLNVGSAPHAVQTAQMLEGIEKAITEVRPDVVVVYGDTNSTLAGSIAAAKMHVPVAHIEAGLRSFNKGMPEEINRILTDHCSTWLFCPTATAVKNLQREGIDQMVIGKVTIDRPGVVLSGDVMLDNALHFARQAEKKSTMIDELGLKGRDLMLATIHRAANTDDPRRLAAIFEALGTVAVEYGMEIVLPLHPRTKGRLKGSVASALLEKIRLIPPVGFLDMIALQRNARLVLTDSGGVQKEAYFFGVPCVILREETEWTEIVEAGMAITAGADPQKIVEAAAKLIGKDPSGSQQLFGDGRAAQRICNELISSCRA